VKARAILAEGSWRRRVALAGCSASQPGGSWSEKKPKSRVDQEEIMEASRRSLGCLEIIGTALWKGQ
jgi:hypothetical protein